jgi:hypothetical protein
MAIQFITNTTGDSWTIATPANAIGSSQSVTSTILTFQLNANLTSTSAIYLFGKENNGFILYLFQLGGNYYSVAMTPASGGPAEIINQSLPLNTPIFIAAVWNGDTQSFYANGTLLGTTSKSGGTTSNTSAIKIGINSGSAANITLGRIAYFDGYALTEDDIVNLLTDAVTPLETGSPAGTNPANWYATLDGTLGDTPAANNAGLANSGTAGAGSGNVNVLSVFSSTSGGSAEYVADLTWTPVPQVPYVGSSGQLFYIGFESPTGTPSAGAVLTAVTDTLPTVLVNGDAVSLYGPVWSDTTHETPFVCYQFLDGSGNQLQIAKTDVVTYSIPFGVVTTQGLGPNGPVTDGAAANYVGQYPPGFGGCSDFTPNPKLKLGFSGWGVGVYDSSTQPFMNSRLRMGAFSQGTYDSNHTLLYIPANEALDLNYWDSGASNNIDSLAMPTQEGVYTFVFQDTNALSSTAQLKIWLTGNTNTCSGSDTSGGPGTGSGTTYLRTVAADGVTVTVSYWLTYPSDPNYTHGYNMGLTLYMKSQSGYITQAGAGGAAGSGPISNFWAFVPGDSTTTMYSDYTGPFPLASGNNTSNPLAISNYTKGFLTAANGAGAWTVRQFTQNGIANWQVPDDLPSVNLWSYADDIPGPSVTINYVRNYNTNPESETYAYSSTKIYHRLLGFDGTDSVGNYIDLTLHTGGEADMGAWGGYFLEAVCDNPHGYRGGDMIQTPSILPTDGPYFLPCTGGISPPTINGVSATIESSTSITFASSQTVPNGTYFYFSPDTSGQGYRIGTGGTGTTFTFAPPFPGTTPSAGTATSCAVADLGNVLCPVYPTSATTFVFYCSTPGYVSGSLALLSATAIAITPNFNATPYRTIGGAGPYEFLVSGCTEVGAIPWIQTMPLMSDACLQQLAINIAPYLPDNGTVIVELMDEHWNFGQVGVQFCVTYGNLSKYVTPGTVVNEYYTAPESPTALGVDQAYTLIVAHHHNVLQAQFDAIGTGIKVFRLFGSQWATSSVTSDMVNLAVGDMVKQPIPMSGIAVGPYLEPAGSNATFVAALATTGDNPGSWPVAAVADFCQHWLKYSVSLWDLYAGHTTAIAAYGTGGGPTGVVGQINGLPALVGYEGDFNGPNGSGHGVNQVLSDAATADMYYSPGPYPPYTGNAASTTAFLQAIQDGDPRVSGSGLYGIAATGVPMDWSPTPEFWGQVLWSNQPPGDGLGNLYPTFQSQNLPSGSPNQFASAQGGAAGGGGYGVAYDRQNQLLSLNAFLDWIAAAAAPTLTPSFTVKPTRIQPNVTTPRTLTLAGLGTSWSSGSVVSIQNSVSGTTNVVAGTWTAISTTSATLSVTTPAASGSPAAAAGTGSYTITVDGITSAPLVVGGRRKGWFRGMGRLARVAS